jgi:DNA repair exonuclease SbcCD ATPase subunit
MSIQPDEMVSPEAYRVALDRIEELEARLGGAQTEATRYLELMERLQSRICDLERDREDALDLACEWQERYEAERTLKPPTPAAETVDPEMEGVIRRQLLEQAQRGAIPSELHLAEWRQLEARGVVELRDGKYWAKRKGVSNAG